ncbi:interleukin-17 receptor E, partial [Terrapene carolina triunguis]|uniref:interleukin-17 receptor E n=1 Tax=Terrapene triunguis TaxID=2587831 RepID=UPI000E77D665
EHQGEGCWGLPGWVGGVLGATCWPRPPALTRLLVLCSQACRVRADSALPRPRCRQREQDGAGLSPPALALSTARLCQASRDCQPCVRVRLALHTAGLGRVCGLQLDFLVLGSNRANWLRVWRQPPEAAGSLWQVQFDCFPVESGRRVLVSLGTVPDRGLSLNQSHLVPAEPAGPKFSYAWRPEARAIEVSVPEGPALTVRLCHQLALECEELSTPFPRQASVSRGHSVVLPYEFLVPCLCIEASYRHRDSLRTKLCPFQPQPEAYGSELWASMQFHDYSASSEANMVMVLSARCPLHPTATLCWKESDTGACHSVPNSTAMESNQVHKHAAQGTGSGASLQRGGASCLLPEGRLWGACAARTEPAWEFGESLGPAVPVQSRAPPERRAQRHSN